MSGVISAAMKHMIAAGMDAEKILAAVEEIEWAMMYAAHPDVVAAEQRRAKDRERKKPPEGSVENSTECPINKKDINTEGGVGETEKETPRKNLAAVLDEQRTEAVLEHRRRLRKPLTAYAARKLAEKLAKCPDPNLAADEMIAHGWQGIKPEWLNKDPPKGANVVSYKPRPAPRTWAEIRGERQSPKER